MDRALDEIVAERQVRSLQLWKHSASRASPIRDHQLTRRSEAVDALEDAVADAETTESATITLVTA